MTPNGYATLIYYWHGDPHPERIEEMLYALEGGSLKPKDAGQESAVAGVVLSLEAHYPAAMFGWRTRHAKLAFDVDSSVRFYKDRAEWADHHIAHWLISHDIAAIDRMLDAVADGGDAAAYARAALETAAKKCIPFRHALKQARKARADAMVINVTQ